MNSKKQEDDAVDFFTETVKRNGVAVSSVSDGHVLMFDRAFLQNLLNKYADHEKIAIFVKRPTFSN